MLTVSEVSKAYGGQLLFEEASLQVNRGDCVGLVGSNGAGKSTLFSLILGRETADEGEIVLQRNTVLGHLPQESVLVTGETVLEMATAVTPEMASLQKRLQEFEQSHDHDSEAFHEIHARFDELGGYQLDAKAKRILAGLSFREEDFDRLANTLSGGWVMRAYLARLLVLEPDLLLLDEPTNHLDLEALIWFQGYLKNYSGAILLISHDRDFLNDLVGSIVELRQRRLVRYRGNYDSYLTQRDAAEQQLMSAYKNQQREIARLQNFVDRFRAKNTKATQAQSKLKQIGRMDIIEAPRGPEATIDFKFPQPRRTGLKVLQLRQAHFAYGEQVVYRSLDFEVERGQRTVLVGPNGAGKSTLLKLLAGVIKPQAGERSLGYHVKVGYYSQYRVDMLHPENTVLEEALETSQPVTELFVRSVLGSFLFRDDDVFKRISVLSGGEKSRLALVKLLLDPPNLLLMDEPTTHLDLASVDSLLQALKQFQGTVLFISHDVYFIRQLATSVVHVQDGNLRSFPGPYQYYVDKTAQEEARLKVQEGSSAVSMAPKRTQDRKEQRRLEAEARQELSGRKKIHQQRVDKLEKEIAELEGKQRALTEELEDSATYEVPGRAAEINRELAGLIQALDKRNAEWEEAATALHAVTNPEG